MSDKLFPEQPCVLLFQLDGKVPNIALMRIAEHHRLQGNRVELRWTGNPQRHLWDTPTHVYASAIFEKSRPSVAKLLEEFPKAVRLREFGARPYPMPFVRNRELCGFQRWIIGAYDKRIKWDAWQAGKYQPCNLGVQP